MICYTVRYISSLHHNQLVHDMTCLASGENIRFLGGTLPTSGYLKQGSEGHSSPEALGCLGLEISKSKDYKIFNGFLKEANK